MDCISAGCMGWGDGGGGSSGAGEAGGIRNDNAETSCTWIDHAITVNNYVALSADATTLIAGGGAALAAGSGAEPAAAFLMSVAGGANALSRYSAFTNIGLYSANGDWIGAAESAFGSLTGHGLGKLAGFAFRQVSSAEDLTGFTLQALTGEYKVCTE